MTSQTPRLVLSSEGATRTLAVRTYLPLGFMHIMEGFDHLAFVLGLLLLIGLRWRLLAAVTAFTVATSITLALSVLGMVRLPSAQIELRSGESRLGTGGVSRCSYRWPRLP